MLGNKRQKQQESSTSRSAAELLRELGVDEKDLECPICQEIMVDPVIAADGHSYEREQIVRWLLTNNSSPKTGKLLPNKNLISNFTLRSLCHGVRQARGLATGLTTPAAQTATTSIPEANTTLAPHATVTDPTFLVMATAAQRTSQYGPRLEISVLPFPSNDPNIAGLESLMY
jgi:hypothetical protein